ncbi:TPA: hypothetical protein N0F65_003742 [Lagenidium giganteum]|uniref:Nudix hydrolase domain-containing protein n=1 Tax=Lagenidium giganteum TaxID=4803 RepID=A0AAV2YLQ8_9STRA|nr:TPA: hypothetical protein N0F65_003742 [Lagenidium giganteum]
MMTQPRKLLTLAFVLRPSSTGDGVDVLLGEKKRGFGMGKWNGFGGKVEASDASIAAATARELEEEAFVCVAVDDLDPRGVITFSFEGGKEILEVHIFVATKFTGEPTESEEMRPQWYAEADIPYNQMWADDRLWLPHVLAGKSVAGHAHFADEQTILHHDLRMADGTAI